MFRGRYSEFFVLFDMSDGVVPGTLTRGEVEEIVVIYINLASLESYRIYIIYKVLDQPLLLLWLSRYV
jgi:coproporphyrinogen III oxidase